MKKKQVHVIESEKVCKIVKHLDSCLSKYIYCLNPR